MQLITHQNHIDQLKSCPIKARITARFNQLSEDTDVPPNLILVEPGDDITGSDYAFVGSNGLLSDLYDEHVPSDDEFISVFQWISYLPTVDAFEMLYIEGDLGYWFIVPMEVVGAHPKIKVLIESQELSEPQPLY